jgi:2-dehydro-3-deoxygluconokinase
MASAVVSCFGEILLRLAPPGRQRLLQTPALEVQVGGAEANVAVSLCRLGSPSRMLGVLPASPLGDAALGELRRHGVDTSAMQRGEGRMGLYFLAAGAMQRPSEVLYDRADSAFALVRAEHFDWPKMLAGSARLHLSGVTPALGQGPAEAALAAAQTASAMGIPVSFDGNFRGKLWQRWGGNAPALLRGLMAHAELLFADHRDMAVVLGQRFDHPESAGRFEAAAQAAFGAFPRLRWFTTTHRQQLSVDHHRMSASLAERDGGVWRTAETELNPIVDRIGGGDAFAAGFTHALHAGRDALTCLSFALAACCLKHSVPGDFNLVGADEVEALLAGVGLDVRR